MKVIPFLFLFVTLSLSAQPTTWNSSTTYSVGDLVISGTSSYIAVQANSNQQPPNTTYWHDLSATAANLSVPTEEVPTLSTETILASLPNTAPSTNFLNESANYGNAWKRSSWFGVFWKTDNSTWIYQSNLGWVYPSATDSNSTWLYNAELGWIWTAASVYPMIYRQSEAAWNYFETSRNRIYSYSSNSWIDMQGGANGVFPLTYSSTESYFAKDLVFQGSETYISQQSNKGQQPVSNPSNWINLNTLASSLSAPVEAVPNTSREIILSSLPNSLPQSRGTLWDGHITLVDEWKQSSWFGTFLELNNTNGWLFHTKLSFIYTDSTTQGSLWFFSPELGWVWTSQMAYPFIYSNSDASWNYFDAQSGSVYNFTENTWSIIQTQKTTGVPQIYSGNNGLFPILPYGGMVLFNGINYLNNSPNRFNGPQDFTNWLNLTMKLLGKRKPLSSAPISNPNFSSLPSNPPNTSGSRWTGEISLGNGWKKVNWFGTFYEPTNMGSSIYHSELGWGRLERTDSTSTWFLGVSKKYWFSSTVHPFYFSVDNSGSTSWKYFNEKAGTHFDYQTSSWKELKDANTSFAPSSFEPYSNTKSYSQNDRVEYNSNFYFAITSNQGKLPSTNTYNFWIPLSTVLINPSPVLSSGYEPDKSSIINSKPQLPPSYTLYSKRYIDELVGSIQANPADYGLVTETNAQMKLIQEKNTSKSLGIAEGKDIVQQNPNAYGLVSQQQYDRAMQEYPAMESNATPYTVGWYFMPNRGWLFTSHSSYPYIYDENTSAWLYFEAGNKKPTFYEYGQKKWFQMTEEE